MVDDKVSVRGKWMCLVKQSTNWSVNLSMREWLIRTMEEGLDTSELVEALFQQGKEVYLDNGKNN